MAGLFTSQLAGSARVNRSLVLRPARFAVRKLSPARSNRSAPGVAREA